MELFKRIIMLASLVETFLIPLLGEFGYHWISSNTAFTAMNNFAPRCISADLTFSPIFHSWILKISIKAYERCWRQPWKTTGNTTLKTPSWEHCLGKNNNKKRLFQRGLREFLEPISQVATQTESCDATCAAVGEHCDFVHLKLDRDWITSRIWTWWKVEVRCG